MDDILSPTDFIQASRVLRLSSPLGEDQLLPERMVVEEGVNRLFEITLSVRAKREAVKPEELIGKLVDVSLEIRQGEFDEDGVRRPFNGLVTDIEEGPPVTRGLRSYTLTIRPQMWLLSRRSDCRIWQDMTSIQVLETLFSEHGLPAPEIGLMHNKPPAQPYSVQWNEDDLSYLLRRLEEDGAFYWFLHEPGLHRLRVTDHQIGWSKPSGSAEGVDKVRLAQGSSDRNHITEWMRRFRFIPGKRVDADWNFETPSTVPLSTTPSLVQMPGSAKRELYEYPARISDYPEAERAGKLRAQASEAEHERVRGQSTVRFLEPGRRFTPYEEPNPEHKYEEFVITHIRHQVVDRSYETAEDQPEYTNSFEAVPSRVPYTPQRTTPRPRIEGAQVAIVAGPEGEEIHPDKYGRIKLWFPWDRRAKKDGSDTCWVRVSQSWAGGLWGSQVIPRIGMEVMVAYVDGDPDRPLVTGVVPNPKNSVPYDLPANKTRSVFKTKTHKGTGSNELRFEDEAGREEVFIHAQRDKNVIVENDFTSVIRKDSATKIERDKSEVVTNNNSSYIGGNYEINVGRDINISAGNHTNIQQIIKKINFNSDKLGKFIKKLTLPRHQGIGQGSLNISVQNTKMETVGVNSTELVGGIKSQFIKYVSRTQIGRDYILVAGMEHHDVAGRVRTIKAGDKILLICGDSRIEMTEDGTIEIQGLNVKIKANKIELN